MSSLGTREHVVTRTGPNQPSFRPVSHHTIYFLTGYKLKIYSTTLCFQGCRFSFRSLFEVANRRKQLVEATKPVLSTKITNICILKNVCFELLYIYFLSRWWFWLTLMIVLIILSNHGLPSVWDILAAFILDFDPPPVLWFLFGKGMGNWNRI